MDLKETLAKEITPKVAMVIVLLSMLGLWAWAFGKIPLPGDHGFVFKSQLESDVETIVGKDISDLKTQTGETSKQVKDIKNALDRSLPTTTVSGSKMRYVSGASSLRVR